MFIYEAFYIQISGVISFLKPNINYKNSHIIWANDLLNHYRTTINQIQNDNQPYRGNNQIIFLSNHRSEADFFIDIHINHNVHQISKSKIKYMMPINSILANDGLIFIKRSDGRKKIFQTVESQWNPDMNLNVYPEGHRNTTPDSLPLKHGFIELAYMRNRPIQISITAKKEHVFNLKKQTVNYDISLYVAYSPLIHPKDYPTGELFLQTIQNQWDLTWNQAYHPGRFNLSSKPLVVPKQHYRTTFKQDLLFLRDKIFSIIPFIVIICSILLIMLLLVFLLKNIIKKLKKQMNRFNKL